MCDLDLLLDLDLHPARVRQTHDQRLISRTEARSAYVQAMGVSKYQTASQDQLGNFELLPFPSLRLVVRNLACGDARGGMSQPSRLTRLTSLPSVVSVMSFMTLSPRTVTTEASRLAGHS